MQKMSAQELETCKPLAKKMQLGDLVADAENHWKMKRYKNI